MNNFNQVCPSGNTIADPPMVRTSYIEDKETLKKYINEHLPAYNFTEIRWLVEEFNKKGYVEIEENY